MILRAKLWVREREKLKENLKYCAPNLRKMSCGLGKVSKVCENSTKKSSKCLSNKFTSGGGTKPGRDLKKPQESKWYQKKL
jgi:hypothetical protein